MHTKRVVYFVRVGADRLALILHMGTGSRVDEKWDGAAYVMPDLAGGMAST